MYRLPILTIAAAFALFPNGGFSQDTEKEAPKQPREKHGRLQLSEEQQVKIDKLKDAMKKQRIDLRAKISSAGVDLKSLMRADQPDKHAILGKQKEISGYRDQLASAWITFWFDANALLTPEQKTIWKRSLRAEGDDHRGKGLKRHLKKLKKHFGFDDRDDD